MYKVIEQYNNNISLLQHPIGFYAIQLADEIIDYNAKHESTEHNRKNAIFSFQLLKNIV